MKVGLYFGSFNPIHIGHMAIANYMVENTEMNQLWFVVSPQNPFKARRTLLADHHRLELVERAIGEDERFRASDIEFKMPTPSYTIDTLAWLSEKHPLVNFVIIMGSDGLPVFPKWKNASEIQKNYKRYVYPRPGYPVETSLQSNLEVVDAPLIEISSSFIRKAISEGKDVRHFLPPGAWEYLDEMNFYR
ncbi:nicotinate (nicotinamide) nucleotide adenylyltransferase [Bacteroidota bacterium]